MKVIKHLFIQQINVSIDYKNGNPQSRNYKQPINIFQNTSNTDLRKANKSKQDKNTVKGQKAKKQREKCQSSPRKATKRLTADFSIAKMKPKDREMRSLKC